MRGPFKGGFWGREGDGEMGGLGRERDVTFPPLFEYEGFCCVEVLT